MASLARRRRHADNTWPGFVDALATLLMVIIFLLMVFVLAQFFLSQALSGRDTALKQLQGQVDELAELLALERRASDELSADIGKLSAELQASLRARDDLNAAIHALNERAEGAEIESEKLNRALDGVPGRRRVPGRGARYPASGAGQTGQRYRRAAGPERGART